MSTNHPETPESSVHPVTPASSHFPSLARLAELTGGELRHADGSSVTPKESSQLVAFAAIDARDVGAEGMFMAVPGTHGHGAQFAEQSSGSSILTDEEGFGVLTQEGNSAPILVVDDCRRWLGPVAAEIHGHPSRAMTVIGVTGTSGKTTTTYMMERALLGHRHVGLIGTTGTRINGQAVPTSLTTPEAPTLQALFARMRDEGVTHVVMEVSSHALVLGRVRGVDFDVAAFTNLSQDHLDFHPTMEDYFQAKSLLFTDTQDPTGTLPTAVVCVDDTWGRRLADTLGAAAVTVSSITSPAADRESIADEALEDTMSPKHWHVTEIRVQPDGTQHVTATCPPEVSPDAISFDLSIPGAFNVSNATLAVATLLAAGEDISVKDDLAEVQVPGRMEKVTGTSTGTDAGAFLALVDYAHKPGAVSAVLSALNEQLDRGAGAQRGRLAVVVGAGGNRDHEKRPKMGAAAARAADLVIITDDNPRDEDAATIRSEVMAGARGALDEVTSTDLARSTELREIGDREAAITAAVAWARSGDIVVIAGKGHEKGQIIGDTVIPFDDRATLRRVLDESLATYSAKNNPAKNDSDQRADYGTDHGANHSTDQRANRGIDGIDQELDA